MSLGFPTLGHRWKRDEELHAPQFFRLVSMNGSWNGATGKQRTARANWPDVGASDMSGLLWSFVHVEPSGSGSQAR
jgi:hypothetical protein